MPGMVNGIQLELLAHRDGFVLADGLALTEVGQLIFGFAAISI